MTFSDRAWRTRLAYLLGTLTVLGAIVCGIAGDWWLAFGVLWRGGLVTVLLLVVNPRPSPESEATLDRMGP